MEKDSPSLRTTNFSFFCRSAHFGNVSPFLVGATNTFSELIHPLVKLPNCVLKQQPHILQFVTEALGSFGFLPLQGAGTGFVVVLPLPHIFDPPLYTTFHYIHYISQRSNAKNCFRITGLQRQDSKPSADNNTRYSPSSPRVYQIHKEGGVVNRFLTARRHF